MMVNNNNNLKQKITSIIWGSDTKDADQISEKIITEINNDYDDKIREINAILGAITQSNKPIIKMRNGTEIDRQELINSLEIKKTVFEELRGIKDKK
jgi:hypothetical protein